MPENVVTPGLYIRQSFPLFEQMAEAIQGWQLDFRQLSSLPSPCWLEQFSTAGMLYSRASLGGHFHQMGGPILGFRTFALRTSGCTDFRWCGNAVYPHSLIVFPSGGEFESVSEPGFDIFTVSLSNALLECIAEIEFHRPLTSFFGEQGQVSHSAGGSVRRLRALLNRLSSDQGNSSVVVAEPQSSLRSAEEQQTEHNLAYAVLACLEQGRHTTTRGSRSKRMKALEKAMELIRWLPPEDIRIPDLVAQVGVSRRTLENAFRDGFGVSPAAYLKAGRLQALNRDLLEATYGGASVASICVQHGFTQLGQLAADYRAMFGELPSVTLQRQG